MHQQWIWVSNLILRFVMAKLPYLYHTYGTVIGRLWLWDRSYPATKCRTRRAQPSGAAPTPVTIFCVRGTAFRVDLRHCTVLDEGPCHQRNVHGRRQLKLRVFYVYDSGTRLGRITTAYGFFACGHFSTSAFEWLENSNPSRGDSSFWYSRPNELERCL